MHYILAQTITVLQILTTLKYKPVPMPENLIEVINEMDSFTTIIQINHFDNDHYTTQEDHFDNAQDDDQAQYDDVDNSEHESYNELDRSQQKDGIEHTGMIIASTFLQNLFLQHLHKGVTTGVSLRPSLLVSLHDDVLHHHH